MPVVTAAWACVSCTVSCNCMGAAFAWWISQNKYYRHVDGAWMSWGQSLYWLDPVRFRLPAAGARDG